MYMYVNVWLETCILAQFKLVHVLCIYCTCILALPYLFAYVHIASPLSLPPTLQAHSSLMLLGEVTGKTISCIIEPHKELLTDMIPPKKHLLKHQPMSTQIALMVSHTHK